ncbi:alkaline phosphatase D family protein [Gordonia alkaliphila]|uniref:alkaline phosphatase D family protein n=1 Tax=Gordonia alkaliphila TaxID=1053547 RepID=UPI001FF3E766|nr:alkaline phosphatase D family protein [Gordonia alkaliphila]MCK0439317.1 alkaline phosphatase D family protein [Gordonia alkaliphila]
MRNRLSANLSRRTFVAAAGAAGVGVLGVGAVDAVPAGARPARGRGAFVHGVASGDPLADRVILWTRVTPEAAAAPGSGRGGPVNLRWEMSTAREFTSIAATGTVVTTAASDHTVKVDAAGLAPKTAYWYRFRVLDGPAAGAVSPVGRTKTAPAAGDDVRRVQFGVASCANWEAGYFGAYRELAGRDELDAVVHLGDYLYEYGPGEYGGKHGPVRTHQPARDIVSLADYRIRHAQYKTDPDLQAAHAAHPFICTWDDHESADNAWLRGAENHDPKTQGAWAARKAAAEQAYYEWMPVRPQVDGTGRHLYRRLRYGTLLELSMLDLRSYRDKQVPATSSKTDSASSSITGRKQMTWLTGGIESSPTTWQLIGNPVMISPILLPPLDPERSRILTELLGLPRNGVSLNADAWDGYTADRRTLLAAIAQRAGGNAVFLTGDIHMSWACEVPREPANYPGAGSLATEFVVTSVTSNNLDDMVSVPEQTLGAPASAALMATNRHTRWVDTDAHGYAVLTVSPVAAQMDWYFVTDRSVRRSPFRHGQSWKVAAGSRRLTKVSRPA